MKANVQCCRCLYWEQRTYDNNGTVEIGYCRERKVITTSKNVRCSIGVHKERGEVRIMMCPECNSNMLFSHWTGDSHCTNPKCFVSVDKNGNVIHRKNFLEEKTNVSNL